MSKLINYRIIVHTKDASGAGTDNFIYMTMHGTAGISDRFELQGNHEQNDVDAFTRYNDDIGIVTKITLDVEGDLADKWSPYSIQILRDTDQDEVSTADGYTEFLINKELGYDPVDFSATHTNLPQVTLTKDGKAVENTERIILVQFDHNPGGVSQTVMKYKETWGSVERIQISTENREEVGVDTKITYESPESVVGKFGAEVGASWKQEITTINEKETQNISQREFDWSLEVDPKTYVFRLQVFILPYTDQVYKDSVGNSRVIRKLRSEIIPAHMGDFLFIPRFDDGKVDPITMRELENDWFVHMDPENVKWIRERHLDKWLTKGWVVYENQPPGESIEFKAVVVTDALNIRKDHDPNSKILGHLKERDEVTVLDSWSNRDHIWVKIKPGPHLSQPAEQWCAMLAGKNRYLQYVDLPRE